MSKPTVPPEAVAGRAEDLTTCPHCGAAHPIVKRVLKRLGADVRFVFRNFPLGQIHPHAVEAAEAAEAAGLQGEGEFWRMHDHLFEHQDALERADLVDYAKELGLDATRFARDLDRDELEARVRGDFASGARSGVNGTPTFFITGARHDGPWDVESLLAALTPATGTA